MTKVLDQKIGNGYAVYNGDCIDVLRGMADESIHYSVFSPPFASLYTYSASPRDMGNCRDHAEFFEHFKFLAPELFRVLKPGRLLSFHCMLIPTSKSRDGEIGLTDFRGDLIRAFRDVGFIHHSEVVIWKDPVTAMQRTKALGLLHKQLKKDSCMSRQGIPDYLVTMRKPGANPEPVTHTNETFPVQSWQNYASPVWMDIDPSDTLQYRSAREEKDERHICPLQLEVIRRALKLWSNPGDTILSPFTGIGSEGVVALEEGRKFVGAELKESYFKQACANLDAAENVKQTSLFGMKDALFGMTREGFTGVTIAGVDIGDAGTSIRFQLDDGRDIVAHCDDGSCSRTWIENVELPALGFPAKVIWHGHVGLEGLPVGNVEKDGSVVKFYGYNIKTDRGDIDIDYRNESNGYYGGSLRFPWDHE